MEEKDKVLLHYLQVGFLPERYPFRTLAVKIDMTEKAVLARLNFLKAQKYFRYVGAFFDTKALGYESLLVACHVSSSDIDRVAEIINAHPGVSHNYVRDHEYNVWFTLAVPAYQNIDTVLHYLVRSAGVQKYLRLPSVRTYKLRFVLDLIHTERPDFPHHDSDGFNHEYRLSDSDRRLIRLIQEPLNIVSEPFAMIRKECGVTYDELFEKLNVLHEQNYLRRWGAVLSYKQLGYVYNALVVWKVAEHEVDRFGEELATYPEISHCYHRKTGPQWPYALYSMVHCTSRADFERLIQRIIMGNPNVCYEELRTLRMLKKKKMRYFLPDFDAWLCGREGELCSIQSV